MMPIRFALPALLFAAALLYAGPLLAAMAGMAWRVAPVFVLIFLLYMALMRPGLWPQSRADWENPQKWTMILWLVLVQVGLVCLCFWLGRLIAGWTGFVPLPNTSLPFGLSIIGVGLGRAVWKPTAENPELDRLLDATTEDLERLNADIRRDDDTDPRP